MKPHKTNMPSDAVCYIRDTLRDFARSALADAGSSQDSGGGFGQADFFLTVDDREFVITVREAQCVGKPMPKIKTCPIHGIAECMCDDPKEWAPYVSS